MSQWSFPSVWAVAKDVVLTAGGMALIMSEVFAAAKPSDVVIVTGLAMTGIGASFHLGSIVNGFIGRSQSDAPPPHGSSPSSTSPGPSSDRSR